MDFTIRRIVSEPHARFEPPMFRRAEELLEETYRASNLGRLSAPAPLEPENMVKGQKVGIFATLPEQPTKIAGGLFCNQDTGSSPMFDRNFPTSMAQFRREYAQGPIYTVGKLFKHPEYEDVQSIGPRLILEALQAMLDLGVKLGMVITHPTHVALYEALGFVEKDRVGNVESDDDWEEGPPIPGVLLCVDQNSRNERGIKRLRSYIETLVQRENAQPT